MLFPKRGYDNEKHIILLDVSRNCDLSSKFQGVARSIFSKVNPQIEGGCIIIGLARSNKHTVNKMHSERAKRSTPSDQSQ